MPDREQEEAPTCTRRRCLDCNKLKPLSDFWRKGRERSGRIKRFTRCAVCASVRQGMRWQYDENYRKKKAVLNRSPRKRRTGMDYYRKLQREKHPSIRARAIVSEAIQGGRLKRPDRCSKCKQSPKPGADGRTLIQGHRHRGYSRPLELEWLCAKCHATAHRN